MSETPKQDQEIMIPNHKITIAGQEFDIKPFVIRTRTKVLNIIVDLFSSITKNPNLKEIANVDFLKELLTTGGDRLIEIYEMVLGKDAEWIMDNVTLPDEINLLQTIWEINNFPLLQGQFQKIIEKYTTKKLP